MSYNVLGPEVPGQLGEDAELVHRQDAYPLVTRLHFEFGYGSLGNDLIECHPVSMVTKPLADALRQSELEGYGLSSDIVVTVDENVRELEPEWPVPALEWLQVSGRPGEADFGLTSDARLVVSDAALSLLRGFVIDDCDINPYT